MQTLSFYSLLWLLLPVGIVYTVYRSWTEDNTTIPHAAARMLLQLIAIGYVLTYIFESGRWYYVTAALSVMLIAASVIALRPIVQKDTSLYLSSLLSIAVGSILTLGIVVFAVLDLPRWYEPRYVIPLAGMILSASMNALSLAGERYATEYSRSGDHRSSRSIAYRASLIPMLNTFFAVGLVSIPGMMTGQILSGTDPIVAVKYQAMVMLMILSSSGLASAVFLTLIGDRTVREKS